MLALGAEAWNAYRVARGAYRVGSALRKRTYAEALLEGAAA